MIEVQFGSTAREAQLPYVFGKDLAACLGPVVNVAADKFDKLHPKCTQLCKAPERGGITRAGRALDWQSSTAVEAFDPQRSTVSRLQCEYGRVFEVVQIPHPCLKPCGPCVPISQYVLSISEKMCMARAGEEEGRRVRSRCHLRLGERLKIAVSL